MAQERSLMWSPGIFAVSSCSITAADPLPRPCRGAAAGSASSERRQLAIGDAQPYLAHQLVTEAVVRPEAEVDANGRRPTARHDVISVCATSSHELNLQPRAPRWVSGWEDFE
jgi:hypothetical protein